VVPSQAGERRAQCACGTGGSVAAASFCPPDKNPLDQHDDKHSLGGVQEHEQSRRDDKEHVGSKRSRPQGEGARRRREQRRAAQGLFEPKEPLKLPPHAPPSMPQPSVAQPSVVQPPARCFTWRNPDLPEARATVGATRSESSAAAAVASARALAASAADVAATALRIAARAKPAAQLPSLQSQSSSSHELGERSEPPPSFAPGISNALDGPRAPTRTCCTCAQTFATAFSGRKPLCPGCRQAPAPAHTPAVAETQVQAGSVSNHCMWPECRERKVFGSLQALQQHAQAKHRGELCPPDGGCAAGSALGSAVGHTLLAAQIAAAKPPARFISFSHTLSELSSAYLAGDMRWNASAEAACRTMFQRSAKRVAAAPVYVVHDNPETVLWRKSTGKNPSWRVSNLLSMEQDMDTAYAVCWSTATEPEQIDGCWRVGITRLDPTKGRVAAGFIDVGELRLHAAPTPAK
jgi:hypothetical protein